MPNTIRQAHRPRVFVSGCYDLLHCGHVEFFRQAAEFGDLRNTHEDNSQRMLNALEPGTVMPIHRHRASSEIVVVIRERSVGYSMTRMATGQSVFCLTRMAKTACLW